MRTTDKPEAQAPDTTPKKHRAKRVALSAVAVVAIPATVAAAAWVFNLGAKGTLGAGQFVASYAEQPGAAGSLRPALIATDLLNPDGSVATAGATTNILGQTPDFLAAAPTNHWKSITLPAGLSAFPGEGITLTVWPMITTQSSRPGNVVGLTGNLPAGWSAKITEGCGVGLRAGIVPTAAGTVKVRFTQTGATSSLNLETSGFGIVVQPVNSGVTTPPDASTFTCATLTGA